MSLGTEAGNANAGGQGTYQMRAASVSNRGWRNLRGMLAVPLAILAVAALPLFSLGPQPTDVAPSLRAPMFCEAWLAGKAFASALLASLVVHGVLQVPYFVLIRNELDRRQKGERWSLESGCVAAVFPALAGFITGPASYRLLCFVQLAALALFFRCCYSRQDVKSQIGRFSPGFGSGPPPTVSTVQRVSALLAVGLLLVGAVPAAATLLADMRSLTGSGCMRVLDRVLQQTVQPPFVDPVAAVLTVAGHFVFCILLISWLAYALPVVLNALVHGYLSSLQGYRIARARTFLAMVVLMLLCLGLVGRSALNAPACALALLLLLWLKVSYNGQATELYLRRMRQLR